ncbi:MULTISPECIES: MCE family protein [Actinosynnema]|uniref:MCE family protein n=1 Tax=Actinosynnema TaxID=40566 RepID=UPI0027E249B8|nr:MCE family protein [Actinosynnema pretiosum]MCP2097122.1 phospholipid/cholesterol/gamma-HCH transport system substrate-binding protein [Actinosynnema pretiosum]
MRALRWTALVAVLVLLAGCSGMPSAYDLPLPGGADVGERPYRVTVEFDDVLDLVPQAAVKVADVPVGRVEEVGLSEDGSVALVRLLVNGDVRLPADARGLLRQSSLLGEKYVELAPGESGSTGGPLVDGAVVPVARTNRNPEVEEVLGALSMLLNGGGIGQVQDISRELSAAFDGNTEQARSLLSTVDEFVRRLDERRDDITRAVDGLARLSAVLEDQKPGIAEVLDGLEPGLRVLEEQRGQLVGLLGALDRLSGVAVDTVERSRDDLVADLKALEPVLRELVAAGQDLPRSLELLLTFPFTDAVLDGVKGDYLNTYLELKGGPR